MGATVHLHYCMNEFTGWSLLHDEADNTCGKCGMKEKNGGCCKDEHKQIKLDIDHQKSTIAQYVELTATPALITPFATYTFKVTPLLYFSPLSNAPPHIPKQRLNILNCVFLV